MTAKRKRKAPTQAREDISKPSHWRLQHGGFEAGRRDVDPETGRTVTHHRAFDTLGMMLANGTITPEMHDAGLMFRKLFRIAALDTLRATPLIRIPGGGNGLTLTEQAHAARRKVAAAMAALAQIGRAHV